MTASLVEDSFLLVASFLTSQARLEELDQYFQDMLSLVPKTKADQIKNNASKYYVNKKEKAPMQQIKEASKKAKKAKLDPELVSKSQEKEDSVEEAIENGVKCPEEEETVNKAVDDLFGAKISGSSIQDLRAKLHERIEMLKERRISKNPEKHQEILKKKAQAKVKKEKKKMHQKMKNESVLAKTDTLKTKEKPKAPAVGKEAVVFSKFAMSTEEKKKPQKKDLTKILKNIEKKKENLEILKTKNPQKLKEIVTNEAWNKAILKSEGEKIKDDPKLIKKSIKAEQKKKSKSASDWAKRIADVEERTKARQTKRSENIQKRKEDINAKKNKKKQRPGFEGAIKKKSRK